MGKSRSHLTVSRGFEDTVGAQTEILQKKDHFLQIKKIISLTLESPHHLPFPTFPSEALTGAKLWEKKVGAQSQIPIVLPMSLVP